MTSHLPSQSSSPDLAVDELRRRARRRLVGAAVLALIAAVVLPMLLESDPKPLGDTVSVEVPPIDGSRFVNRINTPPATAAPAAQAVTTDRAVVNAAAPTTDESAADAPATGELAAGAPAPMTEPNQATAVAPGTSPKSNKTNRTTKVTDATDTREGATAAAGNNGFVVQLAAYADANVAQTLAARLKDAGFPAYTERLATSHGSMLRVRVGPYAGREAAESARGKLKANGYSGIVASASPLKH